MSSDFVLSQSGAKKLLSYLNEHPNLKHRMGASFQTGPGLFLKDACELDVQDINKALCTNFATGSEAQDFLGNTVALGFSDYGAHTVGVDLRALHAVSIGRRPRDRHNELAC